MNWHVREAGIEDVAELALIGAATFLETFAGVLDGEGIVAHCRMHHSAAAYEGYLGSGAMAWLGEASEGKAPVGFAMVSTPDLPTMNVDRDLELKRIYTLSRFHGTGLGVALMDQAVQIARLRADRLLLGVYAGNSRAIAFYEKQGFFRIAARRFNVGGREYDDVVLAKLLR